jgi:uncharacterized protein (DUF1778 family)
MLDAPPKRNPRLERLMSITTPWHRSQEFRF